MYKVNVTEQCAAYFKTIPAARPQPTQATQPCPAFLHLYLKISIQLLLKTGYLQYLRPLPVTLMSLVPCHAMKGSVVELWMLKISTHPSVWRQYASVAAVGGAGRRLQLRGDVRWPARPRSLSYPQPVLECELMLDAQPPCEPSPSPRPRTRNG